MHYKYIVICCFFIIFLCSCKNGEETKLADEANSDYEWKGQTGQTLELWGNVNDLTRPFMRKAFERYEKLTGNKLNIKPMAHAELEAKLRAGFISGNDKLPDIFLFPSGSALLPMNPDENFHDFTQAQWVDDLTDRALTQTICNGRVVGLPHWEASVAGVIYNQKLFNDLGIKVPRNQEEFFQACEDLKKAGVIPMYLPFTEPTMLLYQFPLSGILRDNSLLEDLNDGKIGYSDILDMKKIVEWYRKMAQLGNFGPEYWKDGWDGMDEAMKSGKYAMMLCWDTWLYSDFTGNPDDFGIMPAFIGAPPDGVFEGPNLMLLIVNEKGPKKQAAIEFINFMADPVNYNSAFANFQTAPVFKKQTGSLTTPQYDAKARYIEQHLRDSTARPLILGFAQVDARYIECLMRDPNYSVEDCLKDMDQARLNRVSALLQKYSAPDVY